MERYHEMYRFCLAGMGAGWLLSLVLFIRLDIRTAVRVLRGKGEKQTGQKQKSAKIREKRQIPKNCREEKTVQIAEAPEGFLVVEEILLVHTKECI